MPRYIDADEFQKAIEEKAKRLKNLDTINGLCGAISILYEQPTADVQPVNHGEWKKVTLALYKCSECGNEICSSEYGLSKQYKYCSQCGAKMDKENKDGKFRVNTRTKFKKTYS